MENKKIVIIFLIIAILTAVVLFAFENFSIKYNNKKEEAQIQQGTDLIENNEIEELEKQQNAEIKKEDIHITMTAIGDIMCHNSQYKDAYNSNTGTYDF